MPVATVTCNAVGYVTYRRGTICKELTRDGRPAGRAKQAGRRAKANPKSRSPEPTDRCDRVRRDTTRRDEVRCGEVRCGAERSGGACGRVQCSCACMVQRVALRCLSYPRVVERGISASRAESRPSGEHHDGRRQATDDSDSDSDSGGVRRHEGCGPRRSGRGSSMRSLNQRWLARQLRLRLRQRGR